MEATSKYKNVFEAANQSDTEAVKSFIEKKPSLLRFTNEEERTVALFAAQNNNFPLLKYALELDNSILYNGDILANNIMTRSIEYGALDTVKYLVEHHNWDIHRRNNRYFGNTAIHHAAEEGQMQIMKYFVEEKAGDVNVRNNVGDPPLFCAVEKPFMNMVKYLVEERKADVTAMNDKRENVLFVSAVKGDLNVPKYLLDELKVPIDINWKSDKNHTAPYLATRWGKLPLLEYLVQQKHADVNTIDGFKRSLLHVAAFRNNYDVCKFLVEHGANMLAKDKFGNTPLDDAINEEADEKLVTFLREATAQKRSRRSVEMRPSAAVSHSNCGPTLAKTIVRALSQSRGLLGAANERNSANRKSLTNSEFDAFLVVANTFMRFRYAKESSYRWSKHEALLSPVEIVESRTDPVALGAVSFGPSER
jgi:ankyrin repeat protein